MGQGTYVGPFAAYDSYVQNIVFKTEHLDFTNVHLPGFHLYVFPSSCLLISANSAFFNRREYGGNLSNITCEISQHLMNAFQGDMIRRKGSIYRAFKVVRRSCSTELDTCRILLFHTHERRNFLGFFTYTNDQ